MTKKELLEKQNLIYTIAIDRVWDHIDQSTRKDLEWIWDSIDEELIQLQKDN